MAVKSAKTWSANCRPTGAELRLACSWVRGAALAVERDLDRARHDPSIDAPALRSKLGKLKSGIRVLEELRRLPSNGRAAADPIRIAGRDVSSASRSQLDCALGHVTSDSVAQIAAALNANVFRARSLRGRRLRMLRGRADSDSGVIEFGWIDDSSRSPTKASAWARTSAIGTRFSLIQYFNAGSFQAAYTAGAAQQATALGLTMNERDPADADMRAMIRRIDAAIADQRTRGLIVHSGVALELQPLLRRAHESGKAIVASHLIPAVPLIPSIVLDDVGTGLMLGEAVMHDLGDENSAEILLLGGTPRELVHMQLRQQGFLDALRRHRQVRARSLDGDTSLATIVEELRRKTPRAIVAFYDDVSRYAAQAIEIARMEDRVTLYGVDLGDPEIEEMQARPFWRASVAVDAFALGAASVRLLAAHLRDAEWSATQRFPLVVPGTLIRREDLLTVRDKTAAGLARAFGDLTRWADRICAPDDPEARSL
jgi:ABC-type sugar transport system substrate-binding protein